MPYNRYRKCPILGAQRKAINMTDYKSMYLTLFQAMTDAIEILQLAQQTTEEMYISSDDTPIKFFPLKNDAIEKGGDYF